MKYENIILVTPCNSYGDTFSVVPMVYYLLNYYNNVYFLIEEKEQVKQYFINYFSNDPLFEKRIFVIDRINHDDIDICDLTTDTWTKSSFKYSNIKHNHYFNPLNPLYSKLDIPADERCESNISLPLLTPEVNHIVYYKLVGLNNNVRMNYFNYVRNVEIELKIKDEILKRLSIVGEYCIVNNPENQYNLPKLEYPSINISYLTQFFGNLLTLIENARSIHLVEGVNSNFIYQCQYKNIIKYDNEICLYVWARNRNCPTINLDYAWKMFDNPRLNNWKFLFNE